MSQLTHGEITAVDARRALHLGWAEAAWDASTDIGIGFEESPAGTCVVVRGSGWDRFPNATILADEHRAGWRMHLEQWRRYVEGAHEG